MIRMKALCSFGIAGSNEGKVRRGREFMAASEARAKDLEKHGLAFRLFDVPLIAAVPAPASNKAAVSGPLPSAGGETGAANAPSSSDQVRPQRRRTSRKSADALDL